MKSYFFILIVLIISIKLTAQDTELLNNYKDSIKYYSTQMVSNIDDKQRIEYSNKIEEFTIKLVKQKNSITFDMKELRLVKVITSEDNKLRVFTWVIPFSDKTYAYKGVVQSYSKTKKDYFYYKLNDNGDKLRYNAHNKSLSPKKWYGAYYYKIVQTKRGKKRFYTLIGWRGIDRTTQSKVVEVATLKSNGNVTFGYNLFNIKGYEYFENTRGSSKRLIFKFSTQGSMYMNYDFQTIVISTKKEKEKRKKKSYKPGFNAQVSPEKDKVKTKSIKSNMIVMDRLVPTSPQMKEFYEFYYPESNIIDALLWQKNKWTYYSDIDARNKDSEVPIKHRNIEYNLTPQ